MARFQRIKYKKENEIAEEWDNISYLRYKQISEKKDLSYEYILKPYFFKALKEYDTRRIVDIGCGTGNLTSDLSNIADFTLGLDLSADSIELAKSCFGDRADKIKFTNQSIGEFASKYNDNPFSLAIANMSFMDILNLEEAFVSTKRILEKNASLIFSITHPCFWPKYWGYENEQWFNYKEETIVESDFVISLDKTEKKTTHLHRSLETYINTLSKSGFLVEKIVEPVHSDKVADMFPKKFNYPRFMFIHAKSFT